MFSFDFHCFCLGVDEKDSLKMELLGKVLIFLCVFTSCVSAYRAFQKRIPNGDRVPDTCFNISHPSVPVYAAVAHEKGNARRRNSFGRVRL